MALLRRAETGLDPADPRAATPIGILWAKGLIDETQYDAAVRFESKHNIARHAMALPNLETHDSLVSLIASSEAASPVYGIEEQDKASQVLRCEAVLRECYARICVVAGELGYRLVDDVILHQRAPACLSRPERPNPFHAARAEKELRSLRASLDELARYFKIDRRER